MRTPCFAKAPEGRTAAGWQARPWWRCQQAVAGLVSGWDMALELGNPVPDQPSGYEPAAKGQTTVPLVSPHLLSVKLKEPEQAAGAQRLRKGSTGQSHLCLLRTTTSSTCTHPTAFSQRAICPVAFRWSKRALNPHLHPCVAPPCLPPTAKQSEHGD